MIRFIWLLFLLCLFLVVMAFGILNSQMVTFDYFVGQLHLPLVVLVIGSFVLGGIIGLLIGLCRRRGGKSKLKSKS